MGAFLRYFGAVGGIPPDLRNFLQGGCSVNPIIWIGYLVDDSQDQAYPMWVPS